MSFPIGGKRREVKCIFPSLLCIPLCGTRTTVCCHTHVPRPSSTFFVRSQPCSFPTLSPTFFLVSLSRRERDRDRGDEREKRTNNNNIPHPSTPQTTSHWTEMARVSLLTSKIPYTECDFCVPDRNGLLHEVNTCIFFYTAPE